MALKPKHERQARYKYIGRREQDFLAQMKAEHLVDALERGNVRAFIHYIALLHDLTEVHPEMPISDDWKEIIELPYTIFNAAIGRNNPPPINNERPKSTLESYDRAFKK